MHRGWRALATAGVTSVLATAALAVVVQAAPAPREGSVIAPAGSIRSTGGSAEGVRSVALGSVTEHAIDPQLLAAVVGVQIGAAQSVSETIQVAVTGGDISLVTQQATVVLTRAPGSDTDWVGTLPPIRIVDARGTGAGWRVLWRVAALDIQTSSPGRDHTPSTAVRLEPAAPAVIAGSPVGVTAGRPGRGVPSGRTLFRAAEGCGGGTYEAGGTVSARLPASVDAAVVTFALALA